MRCETFDVRATIHLKRRNFTASSQEHSKEQSTKVSMSIRLVGFLGDLKHCHNKFDTTRHDGSRNDTAPSACKLCTLLTLQGAKTRHTQSWAGSQPIEHEFSVSNSCCSCLPSEPINYQVRRFSQAHPSRRHVEVGRLERQRCKATATCHVRNERTIIFIRRLHLLLRPDTIKSECWLQKAPRVLAAKTRL
jgi:hypothetical protein